MKPLVVLLVGGCAMSLWGPVTEAAGLELKQVPAAIPAAQREPLERERAKLTARKKAYNDRAEAHDRECASVTEGSALDVKCAQAQVGLDRDWDEYVRAATAFGDKVDKAWAETRQRLEAELQTVKQQIEGLQEAIRRFGFNKREEDFTTWGELARESKEVFEEQAINALVTRGIALAKASAGIVAAQNPWTANHVIAVLKEAGVTDPFLLEAIEAIGNTQGKPEMARKFNDVLDQLRQGQKTIALARKNAEGSVAQRNKTLKAFATALAWMQTAPQLRLLVTEAEFATFVAYSVSAYRVSADQIERLTVLTEQDLKTLKAHTDLMKKLVQQEKGLVSMLRE